MLYCPTMKLLLWFALAASVSILVYSGISFWRGVLVSKKIVSSSVAFSQDSNDFSRTLLVLGDSTAVGVGASAPEESVAGLLAQARAVTYTENRAASGARAGDLLSQFSKSSLERYDIILVQIGANDIIRFYSAERAATELEAALVQLREKSNEVIVMSAGNVGAAPLFPFFLRPFYTELTLAYHDAFAKVASTREATYVNLYVEPNQDPFLKEPEVFLAADGLHPTSAGYKLWFNKLPQNSEE